VYSAGNSSIRAGQAEIFSVDPRGGPIQQLTRRPEGFTGTHYLDIDPAWSPDGREIVFSSNRAGGSDLYRMDADGSHEARIASIPGPETEPAWSRDGTRILFVGRSSDALDAVWSMKLDGTDRRRLTQPDVLAEASPSWSPVSERVAFAWEADLWLSDPDGSNQANVTNTGLVELGDQDLWLGEAEPDWSPDGRRLVFSMRNRLGGDYYGLWTIGSDGRSRRRLTALTEPVTCCGGPAWSPDGDQVAFGTGPDAPFYARELGTTVVGVGEVRVIQDGVPEGMRVFGLDWQPLPNLPGSAADCRDGAWGSFGYRSEHHCLVAIVRARACARRLPFNRRSTLCPPELRRAPGPARD
jgi:dipeptidyl aminopeptidase/acylaminoacyl peptidase